MISTEAKKTMETNWFPAIFIHFFVFLIRLLLIFLQVAIFKTVEIRNFSGNSTLFGYDFDTHMLKNIIIIAVMLLADLLLISPLLLGKVSFYKKITSNKKGDIKTLFSFYGKRYFQSIIWRFGKAVKTLLIFAACVSPYSIVVGFSNHLRAISQNDTLLNTNSIDLQLFFCTILKIPILILGLLLFFIISLRYSALSFIIVESTKSKKIKGKSRLSKNIMNGNALELGSLYMRYCPLFLSIVLVLPAFFVLPLFQVEKSLFIKAASSDYHNSTKKTKETETTSILSERELLPE